MVLAAWSSASGWMNSSSLPSSVRNATATSAPLAATSRSTSARSDGSDAHGAPAAIVIAMMPRTSVRLTSPPALSALPALRPRPQQELAHEAVELLGLLELRHVAAVVDDHFFRAGNRALQAIGSRRVGQLVVPA